MEEVSSQLEHLLQSPLFRQSRRYPAFLRHVVEHALAGKEDSLKERVIGIELFGRQPSYDTSSDPTVRLTAAEVRKRLAQYYQDEAHSDELRIVLRTGSYIPSFHWLSSSDALQLPAEPAKEDPAPTQETGEDPASGSHQLPLQATHRWMYVSFVLAFLLLAVLSVLGFRLHWEGRLRNSLLLGPALRDPGPVQLVVPDVAHSGLRDLDSGPETPTSSVLTHIRGNRLVDFNDSIVEANVAGLLHREGKAFTIRLSTETNYADLQNGPAVLIGGLDNLWCMQLLQSLPFRIAQRGNSHTFEIVSRNHPEQNAWALDLDQPFSSLREDFGIVVSMRDTITGKPILIIAGIGQNATTAAMALLDNQEWQQEIVREAPKGWHGRNVEIVYSTRIIQDRFGPPTVVDKAYW